MTGACPVFVALKYGISGLSPTSAAFMLSIHAQQRGKKKEFPISSHRSKS